MKDPVVFLKIVLENITSRRQAALLGLHVSAVIITPKNRTETVTPYALKMFCYAVTIHSPISKFKFQTACDRACDTACDAAPRPAGPCLIRGFEMHPQALRTVFSRMKRQGYSISKISRALGVSRATLFRWQRAPPAVRHKERLTHRKLDQTMTRALVRHFRDDNTITLQQAATWLVSTFGVKVTIATVGNYCRRLSITYKKATKAYTEMNETRAAQWLQDIAVVFGPHVIALDEAAFFYNHVRGYAWSRKGSRAIVKRPGQRGQAHSLLLCIGLSGVIHWQLYTGAVKAVDFVEFLRELPRGSRLVLDNCQIHRATNVLRRQGLPTVAETAEEQKVELRYRIKRLRLFGTGVPPFGQLTPASVIA